VLVNVTAVIAVKAGQQYIRTHAPVAYCTEIVAEREYTTDDVCARFLLQCPLKVTAELRSCRANAAAVL